jgi:hypothetical protein
MAATLATEDFRDIYNVPNTVEASGNAASEAEEMAPAVGNLVETWEPLLDKVQIFVNISDKLETVRIIGSLATPNVFIFAT